MLTLHIMELVLIVKVSIVIITYKNPKNLRRALITATNQTYKNKEIIVVDGANWQVNENVVKEFGPKIIYKEVEPKAVNLPGYKGAQNARNVGCKIATGEWIAMLDDDDEWTKDKIEKQVGHIDANISLIVCWAKTYTENGYFLDKPNRIITYKYLLKNFNLSNTSSYFIRKKTLEEVGWWDIDVKGMQEYDIALKISKRGYDIVTVCLPLLIRNRNFDEQLGSIYWKIAERFQFWNRYGDDALKLLTRKEIAVKLTIMVGLLCFYSLGYILHNRIWKIIYPLKRAYEGSY